MIDKSSKTLASELSYVFVRKLPIYLLFSAIIALLTNVSWSTYQLSMTEKQISDGLAASLGDAIRAKDLITIQRTIGAYKQLYPTASVCIRDSGGMNLSPQWCGAEGNSREYVAPLSQSIFHISVYMKQSFSNAVGIFVLFLAMIFSLFLLRLAILKFNFQLRNDLHHLFDPGGTHSFHFSEFDSIKTHFAYASNLELEHHKVLTENEKQQALVILAAQVAHDIRSPLAALMSAEKDLKVLPEDTRILIRGALNRIRDIANNLLEQNKAKISKTANKDDSRIETGSVELLSSLIDSIVSEKRLQNRSLMGIDIELQLEPSSYGLFAELEAVEFKRVISNLINNSVEAFDNQQGRISVCLKKVKSSAVIEIADNGKGIPHEILGNLMNRGETFGKEQGSGLGLYHARSQINEWGGEIKIESQIGQGTSVTIEIPAAKSPDWFVQKLFVPNSGKVLILDDDAGIHQIWQSRFEEAGSKSSKVSLAHASTPKQADDFIHQFGTPNTIYLFDYELLGSKVSGLDLIEKYQIQKQAVLVTSRFEEPSVRERCSRMGVKLIPKSMAAIVPIEIEVSKLHFDAVLIDDDPLVHMTWNSRAKALQKNIKCYSRSNDFLMVSPLVSPETPLYIDSNLGSNTLSGNEVAEELHQKGFKNIFIATGYSADQIKAPTFLKGIIGKEPPF